MVRIVWAKREGVLASEGRWSKTDSELQMEGKRWLASFRTLKVGIWQPSVSRPSSPEPPRPHRGCAPRWPIARLPQFKVRKHARANRRMYPINDPMRQRRRVDRRGLFLFAYRLPGSRALRFTFTLPELTICISSPPLPARRRTTSDDSHHATHSCDASRTGASHSDARMADSSRSCRQGSMSSCSRSCR